jgi:hypothetical protein
MSRCLPISAAGNVDQQAWPGCLGVWRSLATGNKPGRRHLLVLGVIWTNPRMKYNHIVFLRLTLTWPTTDGASTGRASERAILRCAAARCGALRCVTTHTTTRVNTCACSCSHSGDTAKRRPSPHASRRSGLDQCTKVAYLPQAGLGCSPRRGLPSAFVLQCAARLGHGPSEVGLKSAEDRPLSARPATLGKAGLCLPAFPGLQIL